MKVYSLHGQKYMPELPLAPMLKRHCSTRLSQYVFEAAARSGCGLPDVSRAHTSNHYRVSTWREISPTISRVSSVALHHGGTGISSTARAEVNVLARGKCLAEGKAV